MIVAITGATGHIGLNLLRKLADSGHGTRVLVHRTRRGLDGLDVEQVHGGVEDYSAVLRLAKGADLLVHLAAYISLTGGRAEQETCARVNVRGTGNVMRAALEAGVNRVVHVSSVHAVQTFGPDFTVSHDAPLNLGPGVDHYSRTKAMAEMEVDKAIEAGLDVVIVRPTAVLGPLDMQPSDLGLFVKDFLERRVPSLVTGGGFDFVDARDVASGILSAAQKGRTGEKYFLSGTYASVARLGEIIEQESGTPRPWLSVPIPVAMLGTPFASLYYRITGKRPRFTKYSLKHLAEGSKVDRTLTEERLGYSPRPLEDTVRDTVAWFDGRAGRDQARPER